MSKFYTSKEVANMLQIAETTVRKYIRNKKLVAYKFGKEYRISPDDLREFMESVKNTNS